MFSGAVPQDTERTGHLDFKGLGLGAELVAALEGIGFRHPTPIQAEAIPPALEGSDLIALAQTGSGKTAAFGLPLVERLSPGSGVRALVLAPTREIALQTQAFLDVVAPARGLKSACIIGGVKMGPQIRDLKAGPDIVVATPGRLLDHYGRGNIELDRIEMFVLDEGDHMLDLGFMPQIRRVLEALPARRQTMLFSATMPPPIERLSQQFLRDPEHIDILPEGRTADGIEHRLYLVEPSASRDCLMALVGEESDSMLIFLRRKVDAEWACRQLGLAGISVERIHSDRSQSQRVAALSGLREGEHRVLVATDIAARGLDLPIVGHIVNYGMPETVEDYIHRAGRTARGAMEGIVSTIATWQDKIRIREVERALGRQLPRCTVEGIEPYLERKSTIRGRKRLRRRLL